MVAGLKSNLASQRIVLGSRKKLTSSLLRPIDANNGISPRGARENILHLSGQFRDVALLHPANKTRKSTRVKVTSVALRLTFREQDFLHLGRGRALLDMER